MTTPLAPVLANIRLHPIKSLDPVFVSECRIGPAGGLALDRAWALYSVDGRWVNGKRTPAIHLIRAHYSPDLSSVTLSVPGDRRQIPTRTFDFPSAHEDAAEWFSVFFEQQIIVRYSPDGFPDDTVANGPTIVSTSSLQAVCEWFTPSNAEGFPGLTLDDVRLRFRTSLEIDLDPSRNHLINVLREGTASAVPKTAQKMRALVPEGSVSSASPIYERSSRVDRGETLPAFWEDRLFGEDERSVVRFRIGEVAFEGSNPCARCPVPPRDPFTGIDLNGFQKHFTRQREATLPPWSPRARFDHFYRFATNTRVAPSESGKLLRQGDTLSL